MRNTFSLPLLIAGILLLAHPFALSAQEIERGGQSLISSGNTLLELFGGADYLSHGGAFATTDGRYSCCGFDGGSGMRFRIGLAAWIPVAPGIFLVPRYSFGNSGGTFTQTRSLPIPLGGGVAEMQLEEKFRASLPISVFDLFGAVNVLNENLHLFAGPTVGLVSGPSFSTTETIVSPGGATYTDGSRSRTFEDQTTEIERTQFGITFGAAYAIPWNESFTLFPHLEYTLPLTRISREGSWKASRFGGMISLVFAL